MWLRLFYPQHDMSWYRNYKISRYSKKSHQQVKFVCLKRKKLYICYCCSIAYIIPMTIRLKYQNTYKNIRQHQQLEELARTNCTISGDSHLKMAIRKFVDILIYENKLKLLPLSLCGQSSGGSSSMANDKRKQKYVLTNIRKARTNAVIFIIFGQSALFSAISIIL